MLKRLVGFGLFLALISVLPAAPTRRAMVLAVQGEVLSGSQPIRSGQLLDDSSLLDLKHNATVTLILLNKGQRVAVEGEGQLRFSTEGLAPSAGARVRVLDSNQQKVTLNGENHRSVGGLITRDVEVGRTPLDSTVFDSVEVLEGHGVLVSRPAGQGPPPALCFHFLASYTLPDLTKDGKAACLLHLKEKAIWSPVIQGHRIESRWVWEAVWPKLDYQSMGLVVTEEEEFEPLLYTWLYRAGSQEQSQLLSLAREVESWRAREPESIEPLVLYASLLEDRRYLEAANQQLDKALALKNKEPGLLEMKARVLTELGRYSEAGFLAR
jgi:hypothetical protein